MNIQSHISELSSYQVRSLWLSDGVVLELEQVEEALIKLEGLWLSDGVVVEFVVSWCLWLSDGLVVAGTD